MARDKSKDYRVLQQILEAQRELLADDHRIIHDLESHHITHFTPIHQEPYMASLVSLAAGNTAVFATTPLPAGASPAGPIEWTSSDPTNCPVETNPNDPTNLSVLVGFAPTCPADLGFSLTITYTNSDGTKATQSNSFTTAPATGGTDISGFTDIVQTA